MGHLYQGSCDYHNLTKFNKGNECLFLIFFLPFFMIQHYISLSEKLIVLNMIKMAACGELQDPSMLTSASACPQTLDSQTCNIWCPAKSTPKYLHSPNKNGTIYEEEEDFNFPPLKKDDNKSQLGGLCEIEALPPNFPKNDSVICGALNLSRQASRDHSKAGPGMLGQPSKKAGMEELVPKWQKESHEMKKQLHKRSSPLTPPIGHIGSGAAMVTRTSALQRVKSKGMPIAGANEKVWHPPASVKVGH